MYWFLAILAVVVGILLVIAITNHRKRVAQRRREAEQMAEQRRQAEERRAEKRRREAEQMAEQRRQDEERRAKQKEQEERAIAQVRRFYLKLNELPFQLDEKQIIYVENEYDEAVNEFILRNYDEICKNFRGCGYQFCYLPKLVGEISEESRAYYKPGDKRGKKISIKSSLLLDFMSHPENREKIKPSLIYALKDIPLDEGEVMAVCGLKIGDISLFRNDLNEIISLIIKELDPIPATSFQESFSYSLNRGGGDSGDFDIPGFGRRPRLIEADEEFDKEAMQLVYDIRRKVERLKVKGISKYILEQMIFEQPKLSRLVVTHDLRILLPDYNNMEIVMTPLVKSVYLLFLSHPEGIPFKYLPDYRKELLGIYLTIKGESEPTEEMIRSIDMVTNPYNNSINEKCARIREAFISKFDETLAQHYFVIVRRGEPKRITLSRDLVEWE